MCDDGPFCNARRGEFVISYFMKALLPSPRKEAFVGRWVDWEEEANLTSRALPLSSNRISDGGKMHHVSHVF